MTPLLLRRVREGTVFLRCRLRAVYLEECLDARLEIVRRAAVFLEVIHRKGFMMATTIDAEREGEWLFITHTNEYSVQLYLGLTMKSMTFTTRCLETRSQYTTESLEKSP